MSINSIPVNIDNRLNIDNPNLTLDNQAQDSVDVSSEKKATEASNIAENRIDKSQQSDHEALTVSEGLTENSQNKEVPEEEMEKAVEIVTSFLHNTLKQVDFSRDNKAGKTVITVVDKKTQEVINQFPSEKIISMAEKIQALHQEVESISGLLIDSHV